MLEHGGNLSWAAKEYGIPHQQWLDLSTGINPHGYPVAAIHPTAWQKLPSDDDGLIQAACQYYGCQTVLATAGSQAIIQALPRLRPLGAIAIFSPIYQEHMQAWQRVGHHVHTFTHLQDPILDQVNVVLVCNPNNPSAHQFANAELLNLHAKLAKRSGWLIVDEAFIDTTPEQSIARHTHLEGLVVLRSIGKFFGLAGARVGFLLATQKITDALQEELGPWTITGPSRAIVRQALADTLWQEKTRGTLTLQSNQLATLLRKHGLVPSNGTSLFQYVPTPLAQAWQHHLATHGIWVRLFTNTLALRFGLPPHDGWQRLEAALATFSQKA